MKKSVSAIILSALILVMALVVPTFAATNIVLTNETYPTSIIEGNTFSVYGIIKADCNIYEVVIGVYKPDGTAAFSYTGKPGTETYDIHNIDYLMTFSKLTAGRYTYRIVVTTQKESKVMILKKDFIVTGKDELWQEIEPVEWNVADISSWNDIDSFEALSNSVDGVILRLGSTYTVSKKMNYDVKFADYYDIFKKLNKPVGCYYFSAATTVEEADAEADHVLKKLKELGCKLELPVYYDLETDAQKSLSQSDCTKVARAFCDKLAKEGYFVGIYCSKYFARDEIFADKLSDYTFWIAQYNSTCTYEGNYEMWQYTETGKLPGIQDDAYVDLNYCYKNFPKYIKEKGLNNFKSNTGTTKPDRTEPSDETTEPSKDPTFRFVEGNGLSIKNNNVIINTVGMKIDEFTKKYIVSENVSVTFSNCPNGIVLTGAIITVKCDDTVMASYIVSVLGDVDCDGKIYSSDALKVLQHSVGAVTLSGYKFLSADYNKDGTVNSNDALLILQYIVK